MSENKKMNSEELKNVAGGQLNPGDFIHLNASLPLAFEDPRKLVGLCDLSGVRKYMKHRCRKCGKKYIIPDMMVPEDYGDSSLCPECNREKD